MPQRQPRCQGIGGRGERSSLRTLLVRYLDLADPKKATRVCYPGRYSCRDKPCSTDGDCDCGVCLYATATTKGSAGRLNVCVRGQGGAQGPAGGTFGGGGVRGSGGVTGSGGAIDGGGGIDGG